MRTRPARGPQPTICPMIMVREDGGMAECNLGTHQCEIVAAHDIQCGGRSLNPHACREGWTCAGDGLAVDAPGQCYRTCGGIAGFACEEGYTCVDRPGDGCDPAHGGADCTGICKAACIQTSRLIGTSRCCVVSSSAFRKSISIAIQRPK